MKKRKIACFGIAIPPMGNSRIVPDNIYMILFTQHGTFTSINLVEKRRSSIEECVQLEIKHSINNDIGEQRNQYILP